MALIYDLPFDGTAGTAVSNGGSDYTPTVGAKWKGNPDSSGAYTPEIDGSGNVYAPLARSGPCQACSPSTTTAAITVIISGLNNRELGQDSGLLLRWVEPNGVGDLFNGGYRVVRRPFSDGVSISKDQTIQATNNTFAANYDHFNTAGAGDTYHVIMDDVASQPRIRVWCEGNTTATPDLSWTDTSGSPYTSGRVGLFVGGTSYNFCKISRIRVWDEVWTPADGEPGGGGGGGGPSNSFIIQPSGGASAFLFNQSTGVNPVVWRP